MYFKYYAENPLGELGDATACHQETTKAYTQAYLKTGAASDAHDRALHQGVKRSLEEYSVRTCIENETAFH